MSSDSSLERREKSGRDDASRQGQIGREFRTGLAFLLPCGLTGSAASGLAECSKPTAPDGLGTQKACPS